MSLETSDVPSAESPPGTAACGVYPSPRQLFVLLVAYFALQLLSRTVVSPTVDLDESEAVVLAQKFSLGYGSAPPLYTWLQIPVFAVFGVSVFGLSLLKNCLLLSSFLLTFAVARMVTRSAAAAVAACLSLFFLPTIAWESQRDLTHTVLASTLSLATLHALLKVHERKRLGYYVLFGVFAGLGLLSKFNYALWLLGLLAAGVSITETRPVVLDRRMGLALAIALVIFAPFGCWMLEHRDVAFQNVAKLHLEQSASGLAALAHGTKEVLQSIVSVVAAIGVIYLVVFFRAPKTSLPEANPVYQRLMARAWLTILFALLAMLVFAKASSLKERWFQPILIALPVFAVSLVQRRLSAARLKVIAALAVLVMAAVAIVLPGRLFAAERLKREETLTRPYPEVAAQIRPLIPPDSLLVCDTRLLAGNLRMSLPGVRTSSPELLWLFGEKEPHQFLVWDARGNDGPPATLEKWASAGKGLQAAAGQANFFQAPYYFHKSKEFRLGLLQLR